MISILQWNINGYFNNYHELQLLIKELNPSLLCLQETHIRHNMKPYPPGGYEGYFFNSPQNQYGKQGVAILIKRGIPHKILFTDDDILSIAVEILRNSKLTIINTYIPPNKQFSTTHILEILNKAVGSMLWLGDVNSWSPIWGSPFANDRGTKIEDALLSTDLVALNDGSPTHFSTHQSFTHVDITTCKANVAPLCTWKTINDLHGSDHFPILTEIMSDREPNTKKFKPKFLTDKADWANYQELCTNMSTNHPPSKNINKEAASIRKIICTAAHFSIPQTKNSSQARYTPWWNSDLQKLRTLKQESWHKFKGTRNFIDLLNYKRNNAIFKHEAKKAKRVAFEEFTSNINPKSSNTKIWEDVARLSGLGKQNIITCLNTPNGTVTDSSSIAN